MEVEPTKESPSIGINDEKSEDTESAANFQKFIYELFDKNGVLNDLRAYLRGHIVNVLKSAQTGDPPPCQKHFTQRLELTFQALNMLIAEYLLRLEFSYSLSVFLSEIPLANMVFDFARTLVQDKANVDYRELKFKDNDVWSILNYLGVQCDSDHANNIIEMYTNEENVPLLLCIMKCIPMYRKESPYVERGNTSQESLSLSPKSSETIDEKSHYKNLSSDKCKHYSCCKACQNRMMKVREKYRRKKRYIAKAAKDSNLSPFQMETLMKNIDVVERNLIDEMFQQLKSVYEAEVEMMQRDEENKVQRSLASHAIHLQRKKNEMEEAFKTREAELEMSVQQKKKFLWGLARALRDQHRNMSRAMIDVQRETDRLTAKENSLKNQLIEAEEILKKRGEEMRTQISNELVILEGHLESMKRERESINKERHELQNMKCSCEGRKKIDLTVDENLKSHYDLLKNELTILKKYLETTKLEPKCVIERSTITEIKDVTSKINIMLNNEQDAERNFRKIEEGRDSKPSIVLVNDLKKKNVNFSQTNLDEIYRDRSRERSRSSASSEAGDAAAGYEINRDNFQRLQEENERLNNFARQQREHIDELTSHQARLQAELTQARFRTETSVWRPRTAPTVMPTSYTPQRVNGTSSVNTLGWHAGAGEQLSLFADAAPRVLVPGDTLPFIGVLRDRPTDCRRHLINQWRALRRISPGISKPRPPSPAHREKQGNDRPGNAGPSKSMPIGVHAANRDRDNYDTPPHNQRPKTAATMESSRREKSPKSVLREAKQNLRNMDSTKDHPRPTREKSPNSVLREAKLRLRKLEIEAEAVEKSYLDFRKRQTERRDDRKSNAIKEEAVDNVIRDLDIKRSDSILTLKDFMNEPEEQTNVADQKKTALNESSIYGDFNKSLQSDFNKYLREYNTKVDFGETHFKNKNTAAHIVKPIPDTYSVKRPETPDSNYLETPLMEFRKLYYTPNQRQYGENMQSPMLPKIDKIDSNTSGNSSDEHTRNNSLKKAKKNKKAEFEILKSNINKIYNLPDPEHDVPTKEINKELKRDIISENTENLLRIEVEKVSETNNVKPKESQNIVVVIESSVGIDAHEVVSQESGEIIPQMTIIVSPKVQTPINYDNELSPEKRSESPEQALTRNDVLEAIFHSDPTEDFKEPLQLEPSKDALDSISEYDKDPPDYPDDFSADVDNYNSRSELDRSPISLPKTYEDENFWDS